MSISQELPVTGITIHLHSNKEFLLSQNIIFLASFRSTYVFLYNVGKKKNPHEEQNKLKQKQNTKKNEKKKHAPLKIK
jgi:hypothetical protein